MPTPNDQNSTRELAALVTFRFGDPVKVYRYAAWTEDVTVVGIPEPFVCVPKLEFTTAPIGGGINQQAWELVVSLTDSRGAEVVPVQAMTEGPHAPVTVEFQEVRPGEPGSFKTWYSGTAARVTKNPPGLPGVVRMPVSGLKSRLAVRLGIIAGPFCWATLGGPGCFKVIAPMFVTGTASAIGTGANVNRLTITGVPAAPTQGTWLDGGVYCDGLELKINRIVSTAGGNLQVDLASKVPPRWAGVTVTVKPGCNGTVKRCREYENEGNFGGVGIATVTKDPRLPSLEADET